MATGTITVPHTDLILSLNSVPTTNTSESCNWGNYDLLIFCATHYNNVRATIVVPRVYFESTTSGSTIQLMCPSAFSTSGSTAYTTYTAYRNGTSNMYVKSSSSSTAMYLKVYGVKL